MISDHQIFKHWTDAAFICQDLYSNEPLLIGDSNSTDFSENSVLQSTSDRFHSRILNLVKISKNISTAIDRHNLSIKKLQKSPKSEVCVDFRKEMFQFGFFLSFKSMLYWVDPTLQMMFFQNLKHGKNY